MQPASPSPRAFRIGLAVTASFNVLSALVGMIGLTVGGGMGLPPEWLTGTGFDSYFWPGIILGVVVGGSQAAALVTQFRGYQMTWGVHAAAGLTMMTWIFVEIALMLAWSPLQAVYFATGLLQVALATLALGAWPRPFLRRVAKVSVPR